MGVEDIYYLMLLIFGTGILSVFFIKGPNYINWVAHGIAVVGCLTAILCAIFVFIEGTVTMMLPSMLPFGAVHIRIDNLSAYFLLAIGLIGMAASLYALEYSREYYERRIAVMAALYNAFLLSMVLVVTVSHIVMFIIVWELMTIVSFLLVNHEYEKTANMRAAFVYIVMTHIGTAFIITAFLLLASGTGSLDFASLKGDRVTAVCRNIIFLCAFLGFGTKAGIIPLHIWLPQAHPAAPSHVSALMSGVMIKTAIYGMCRFYLDFLGTGPLWWGLIIMAAAIISCVLGVLYALMEHDLKRLLAYHSVENIGIILLGVGAGMVFMSQGQAMLAGLSWIAALYHVFNHALFKSLLFMGVGSVLQSAHTRDIEQLGGLIKRMPYTAAFFLIGSAAISALPPLNGFVSEWLTFQALFFLPKALAGVTGKIASGAFISLLGITGALAAACFVKAFGIAFLGKPRSQKAEQAGETSVIMLFAAGLLAGLCIVLGVWPQLMLNILRKVLAGFPGIDTSALFNYEWYAVAVKPAHTVGEIAMPAVVILLLAGLMLAVLIFRMHGKPALPVSETWTCGIVPTPRMEYTATGFSKPIRTAFRSILRPQRETVVDGGENQYFGRKLSYHMSITYVFNDVLYRPVNQAIFRIARFMKTIQTGSVQLYIAYIMAVTVLILIVSAGW